MNHDKLDNWNIIALFPCVYYGLLASYSFFHIFALGDYEGKDGQWGSFKIELWIQGFATLMAFMSYFIGLGLVKKAVWRLSRQKLALITTTSAFLSGVVLIVIEIIESYTWSAHIVLGVYLGGLLLIPALLGVSLVKTGQVCSARSQSIQR
jgi:hypothetical protein